MRRKSQAREGGVERSASMEPSRLNLFDATSKAGNGAICDITAAESVLIKKACRYKNIFT